MHRTKPRTGSRPEGSEGIRGDPRGADRSEGSEGSEGVAVSNLVMVSGMRWDCGGALRDSLWSG